MKTKQLFLLALALLVSTITFSQVGIGTIEPHASAILDLKTDSKGLLPPRLTDTQRDAISSPAAGLTIFNTTVNCMQWYNGTGWYDACENNLQPGPVESCPPPFLESNQTKTQDVTSSTGKIWMDRNLGSYTVARSTQDCWAAGNLYQWGRNSDGHENRTSATAAGPVNAGNEGSNFITCVGCDWLSTRDDSRWGNPNDTDKGIHDPCPNGYRVPTSAELQAELNTFSPLGLEGAFNSPLKLSSTNQRLGSGVIANIGSLLWSSTILGSDANSFNANNNITQSIFGNSRSIGRGVRCIKN